MTGFTGSALCEVLIEDGYHVVAFDDLNSGQTPNMSRLDTRSVFLFTKGDCGRNGGVREPLAHVR